MVRQVMGLSLSSCHVRLLLGLLLPVHSEITGISSRFAMASFGNTNWRLGDYAIMSVSNCAVPARAMNWRSEMIEIKTNRLVIRPFRETDREDLFELYSHENTCRFLLHEAWTASSKSENALKKISANQLAPNTAVSLACVLDGKVIGDISIWYTDMKETVETGFAFHHAYAGKGYATEAMEAIIDYLFTVVKIHRIQACLDARNAPSAKLCRRIGMRKEAHFLKDYWSKGEWTDSFVYGMLLSDFHKHASST